MDSGKSINTSSAVNSQSICESKKEVNHGNSRENQKEFNAKDSNEAISDEKSKLSLIKESKEPSPVANTKSNSSHNIDSKKEISPANFSQQGKKL